MKAAARSVASFTFVLVLASCSGGDRAPGGADSARTAAASAVCPGDNAGLTLPAGFCATVFADSIPHGRHAVVASNGDLYVTLEATPSPEKVIAGVAGPPPPVSVAALRDTNHDGRADIVGRLPGRGNTGIGIANGYLYVDEGSRIVRYARPDSQLLPSVAPEVIVRGMPMEGHRARNFVFGADGALYVNVGSRSNSCQRVDRGNESPGIDPCTELLTRAGIWKFDANKPNQSFTQSARFATGLRNGMGLAFGPDGKLYAMQHGRDQLHTNWPKVFPTTKYSAENPAEEMMHVNQGDDFGWPYCYFAVDPKKRVDAPEYGGDGQKSARCSDKKAPLATYPGHWAPMSLLFYSGSAFPARYRDGAFISFHGSWNRAPEPQEGYRIVFQPMTNGAASGTYETFADGFAGVPPAQVQPGTAKHRPTGIAAGPDGSLYVTDDLGGRVYRITHGAGTR
jgi:glucose/arabinose dehydrogenase